MTGKNEKAVTHVVVSGWFEGYYSFVTKCCTPFFNEEGAVKYAEDMKAHTDSNGWHFFVLPYPHRV
jgi:hypothetical protein